VPAGCQSLAVHWDLWNARNVITAKVSSVRARFKPMKGWPKGSHLAYAAAISVIVIIAIVGFFGKYAFDDSYIGFANAQNLAMGRGFVFSPGQPGLSTSAPLAVFIYAFFFHYLRWDIVFQSQLLSALSVIAIAIFSYAIAWRLACARVAALVSVTLTASPLVLVLWSHESLPAMALSLAAVYCVLTDRTETGALCLGLAALFRAESLILLPLLAWSLSRRDLRATGTFIVITFLPYAIWTAYAMITFHTIFTQSLSAREAQFYYAYPWSYLQGLYLRPQELYSELIELRFIRALFLPIVGLGVVSFLALRRWRTIYTYILIWAALTTAVYLVFGLPFVFWFGLQLPVVIAALVGVLAHEPADSTPMRFLVRGLAVVIFGLNLIAFTRLIFVPGLKFWSTRPPIEMTVEPKIKDNNYYRLALWFRHHAAADASIAYPEIGQLRYYSQRVIVDYIGLGTPGVAQQLRDWNPIWAFERYRPTYYLQQTGARYWFVYVNPTEYDWFTRAYEPVAHLNFTGPYHNHYVIWKLTRPSFIPSPETVDKRAPRYLIQESPTAIAFRVRPTSATAAFDIRMTGRCPQGAIDVTQGSRMLATRRVTVASVGAERVRIAGEVPADQWATVRLEECTNVRLYPPLALRTPFQLYTGGRRNRAPIDDALTIYDRANHAI
jgi:hypothetical protein